MKIYELTLEELLALEECGALYKLINAEKASEEEWRPVKGFEERYEVSDLGRVRSLGLDKYHPGRILKPGRNRGGYLKVDLCKDGKVFSKTVHSIVAEAFLGPRPKGLDINHLDENKENNRADNLEYCTRKENNNHGTHNARMAAALSKAVLQYDLNGNFIKCWPSASEIKRQLGYDNGNISRCCNGKQKAAYHSIWRYE